MERTHNTILSFQGGNAAALETIIKTEKRCAAYYVPSVAILGRCIPNVVAAATWLNASGVTIQVR